MIIAVAWSDAAMSYNRQITTDQSAPLMVCPYWLTITKWPLTKIDETLLFVSTFIVISTPSDRPINATRVWNMIFEATNLTVNLHGMLAFHAFVENCLTFINTSHLHSIEVHFIVSTLWTCLINTSTLTGCFGTVVFIFVFDCCVRSSVILCAASELF